MFIGTFLYATSSVHSAMTAREHTSNATHNNDDSNITLTNIGPYIKTHNTYATEKGKHEDYVQDKIDLMSD
jgi:hypothetical protein